MKWYVMGSFEHAGVISSARRFNDWFGEHLREVGGVYSCSIDALARENTTGRVVVTFYSGVFGQDGVRVVGVTDYIGVRIRYDMVSL